MKNLGKNLITGNFDLLKISLPVKLFEPRSYLQKLADPWIFPRFLDSAAAVHDDPVLRMQWVVTYVVAGFHRAFLKWAKPFNPILGETWQAALPSGTKIFMEQISHHPPVSAFEMYGPHGAYYFHGLSQPSVAYKANAIKMSAKGYRRIEFADGGAIDMTFPAFHIKGLVYTGAPRAELGGTAIFNDHQNGLLAVVQFHKIEGAVAGSLLSRSDAVSGTIYRTKIHPADTNTPLSELNGPNGTATKDKLGLHRSKSIVPGARSLLARTLTSVRRTTSSATLEDSAVEGEVRIPVRHCSGNWLSHLDWEGERYWTLNEEPVRPWIPDPCPLPSDARFREDLAALAAGDEAGAQAAKESLENLQRAEAKMRKMT